MDFILSIFPSIAQWFSSTSWTELLAFGTAGLIFFDRLAKLTPNNTDNAIVEWMGKIFAVLGAKVPDLEVKKNGEIAPKA
jgi:hypothetical protein